MSETIGRLGGFGPLFFKTTSVPERVTPQPASVEASSEQSLARRLQKANIVLDMRDGLQGMPGTYPDIEVLQDYLVGAEKAGISTVIAGIYAGPGTVIDMRTRELLEWMREHSSITPALASLARPDSIAWVQELHGIHPNTEAYVFMSGEDERMAIEGWTEDRIRDNMASSTRTLVDAGIPVISVWEQASQIQIEKLQQLVLLSAQSGASRICIPDTLSYLRPEDTAFDLFRALRYFLNTHGMSHIELECHAHNDHGMANEVSIEAIKGGANAAHATFRGIGERAGNADVYVLMKKINDELARNQMSTRWSPPDIAAANDRWIAQTGVNIRGYGPTGSNRFTTYAGIHAAGIMKPLSRYMAAMKEAGTGNEETREDALRQAEVYYDQMHRVYLPEQSTEIDPESGIRIEHHPEFGMNAFSSDASVRMFYWMYTGNPPEMMAEDDVRRVLEIIKVENRSLSDDEMVQFFGVIR